MITGNNKMAELVHMNYLLVSVMNRFGIRLGFGDKSISQVCKEHSVNIDFFLEIVNSFHDKDYFPQKHLQGFSIQLIIDYLSKTHRYYLDEKIPEIEKLIDQMIIECYSHNEHAHFLKTFFIEYVNELISHIKKEDEKVFPYSINIENQFLNKKESENQYPTSSNYSIKEYLSEHNNIEEKLFDLKNIIIKYLPSPENQALCSKVLSDLFNLEKDINDHSRIEENVLIPKVKLMEEELSNRQKKT